MTWCSLKITENYHVLVNQFQGNSRSKTLSCRKIKYIFRDVKWCFNASWGLKGLKTRWTYIIAVLLTCYNVTWSSINLAWTRQGRTGNSVLMSWSAQLGALNGNEEWHQMALWRRRRSLCLTTTLACNWDIDGDTSALIRKNTFYEKNSFWENGLWSFNLCHKTICHYFDFQ